jgi:hypothetical protein
VALKRELELAVEDRSEVVVAPLVVDPCNETDRSPCHLHQVLDLAERQAAAVGHLGEHLSTLWLAVVGEEEAVRHDAPLGATVVAHREMWESALEYRLQSCFHPGLVLWCATSEPLYAWPQMRYRCRSLLRSRSHPLDRAFSIHSP